MKMKKIALLAPAAAAVLGVSAFLYTQGKPGKRSQGPAGMSAAAGAQLKFSRLRRETSWARSESKANRPM